MLPSSGHKVFAGRSRRRKRRRRHSLNGTPVPPEGGQMNSRRPTVGRSGSPGERRMG